MLVEAYRKGNETKSSNWPSRIGALHKIVLGAGLEPASLFGIRPSNVRVCQFHHPSVEREQTFRRRQRLASVECSLLTHAPPHARSRAGDKQNSLQNEVSAIRD